MVCEGGKALLFLAFVRQLLMFEKCHGNKVLSCLICYALFFHHLTD